MFAMALLLLNAPAPQPSVEQARASAVIVKGVRADAREWREIDAGRRREIIREENGQKVRLRVVDHE